MKKKFTFLTAAFMLLAFLAVPLGMRGQTATLVSGSGTSGYTVPDGWTTSGTVDGGNYLKFDNGTMTSPEFAPHNGLSFTYSVATFGSGTDHPLTIRILNASTNAVITEMTTATPTSSTYINTGSPLSLGDVTVAFKIQMYGPTGKGVRLRNYSVTGTPAGGQQLTPSDLALVNTPVQLEFDLYDNANAQTISYTTSSTGAVTVSQNNYINATVNANNTITVTPVAVTNGPQTITVNQAADNTYAAGSVTFTVDIEDSTPTTGTDVTFDATQDLGNTTAGEGTIEKSGITFTCSNGILGNESEYRLYKNSVTTFSVASGTITKIVFTCPSGNPASGFASQTGWTTSGTNGTWTGNATSVSFTASSAQVRATTIVVTVETSGTPDPTISASNVDIAFNATSGSITYTINNEPSPAGTLTAAVTDGNWLTLGQGTTSPIAFTCSANENTASRTATVTLTYTYNTDQTVSASVTVTQAAAPVSYTTIPALFAAATSTATNVTVTFGGWVVSGVSTNGKNVFVTDNAGNGFVIYSSSSLAETYAVGNTLMGTTGCSLKLNQGYAQLQNVDATELTISTGGTVTGQTIAMASLSGVNTGALVSYNNLTCSVDNTGSTPKYYLSDGTTQLQVYNSLYAFGSTLENGKKYNITGIYQQYGETKEILPRNADDIEVLAVPTIIVSTNSVNVTAAGGDGTINVTYNNITTVSSEVWFCNAAGNDDATYSWVAADINSSNNVEYLVEENDGAARTAYFKVWAYDDDLNPVYSELITITQEEAPVLGGTINFGSATGSTKIDDTSVTGNDSYGNTWTITTVFEGETSFTQNASYSQVGASSKPASTITFTTTLPRKVHIKEFSAKFGGFSGTAGDIYLKVGTTEIGSGSLSGTADVVAENTTDEIGTVLTVTVTNISKGVKCYYISYAFDEVLSITGITSTSNGWYLIAPPVLSIEPTVGNGILSPEYDLYYFDQTGGGVNGDGKEWRNYKQNNFNLVSGKGYLYANSADVDLVFSGTPYSGNGQVTLTKAGSGDFDGYNLIGNPYNTSAAVDKEFYRMNDTHDGIIVDPVASGGTVDAMEGIFVIATSNGETVTFSQSVSSPAPSNQLVMNLSRNTRGSATIDRAIVRFGEGQMLPKFMLNPDNTKLYIPQGNKDYAVVRSEARGEMPVNFKAAENGTYTIDVEAENLEVNYLHLIDNLTGMEVDLLATPSYTFEARKSDIASRFRLVFDANTGNDETNDNFAFINNGELIVNGNGTVQVIDILGRQMFSHEVNSAFRIQNSEFAPGVYVLRLVNGNDVKTQKIVIK